MSDSSIELLRKEAAEEITAASSIPALEDVRIRYLGKKGLVTDQMKKLSAMNDDERKSFGQSVNQVKDALTSAIEARKEALKKAEIAERLERETVDVTLAPRPEGKGNIHPISQVIDEAIAILGKQGFVVAQGPDIEDDFHNFTALNVPPNHPARQMQDTFYLPGEPGQEPRVLRTHTSPVQIRAMEQGKPPFKVIAPGRVYRSDSDLTHTPMFHQIEGLYIDKGIHMGHLKGCIIGFLQAFFELDHVPIRFRPSFFPFTEPSAEVDIGCLRSKDELIIGGGNDWLEILGCGMVHPNVLKNVGIDPEEYQGFAFGLGIERMAMLKYGIPDLRTFFDADQRWLEHYNFGALV
jgi:phenylalanyl-tRNA synthetase alpha chain